MQSNFADTLAKEFDFVKDSMPEGSHEGFALFGCETDAGWNHILWAMCKELQALGYRGRLLQVKEKFGDLRVYYTDQTADTEEVISIAEQRAVETCENCGSPGTMNTEGWRKVRCKKCEYAHQASLVAQKSLTRV